MVAVPQLRSLDGTEITRTERLQAAQVHCNDTLHAGSLGWDSCMAVTEYKLEMSACSVVFERADSKWCYAVDSQQCLVLVVLLQQYSTVVPSTSSIVAAVQYSSAYNEGLLPSSTLQCRWWLLVGGLSQGGLACVSVDGALLTWSLLHPVHVSLSNFKNL